MMSSENEDYVDKDKAGQQPKKQRNRLRDTEASIHLGRKTKVHTYK